VAAEHRGIQEKLIGRVLAALVAVEMAQTELAEAVLSSFAIFLKVLQCFHLILTEDLEQSQV
jgi:hypothetical protein